MEHACTAPDPMEQALGVGQCSGSTMGCSEVGTEFKHLSPEGLQSNPSCWFSMAQVAQLFPWCAGDDAPFVPWQQ